MPPQVIIGKITNHTGRLSEEEIHTIVEQWVASHGGAPKFGVVDDVHAAPAEDTQVLTKAVRAWRQGEGREVDFTQYVNERPFWFGFHHEEQES